MLDFLQLADTYSEKDLESAILREIERFLLELGAGFAFLERPKRITLGDDYYLDLLFFWSRHRAVKPPERRDSRAGTDSPRRARLAAAGRPGFCYPGIFESIGNEVTFINVANFRSARTLTSAPVKARQAPGAPRYRGEFA